jgi:putative FmdB family regulatory protein
MPIYEFRCKECRSDFSKLVRASNVAEVECPSCRSPKAMRLLSVTARSVEADDPVGACGVPMSGGCCMNPHGCGRN